MPSSPASEGGEGVVEQREPESEAPADRESRDAPAVEPDLSAELAEVEDRYKRARADLDNYRKRSTKEIDRRVAESRERLLRDFLEPLDSVERAIRMQPENELAVGLRAVLEQMEAVMARHGVTRFGAPGEPFDPRRHEAIAVQESDEVPDRTVLELDRSGFAIGDQVLRPARVVVSRRGQPES
jgi:molecular chaperone GrpE